MAPPCICSEELGSLGSVGTVGYTDHALQAAMNTHVTILKFLDQF